MTTPKEHRKAVNARFIEALGLLKEYGRISPSSRGSDNMNTLGKLLFGSTGYGHIINDIEKGKRLIKVEEALVFAERYGISQDWIINGNGQPFGKECGQLPSVSMPINPVQPYYELAAKFLKGLLGNLETNERRRLLLTLMEDDNMKKTVVETVQYPNK